MDPLRSRLLASLVLVTAAAGPVGALPTGGAWRLPMGRSSIMELQAVQLAGQDQGEGYAFDGARGSVEGPGGGMGSWAGGSSFLQPPRLLAGPIGLRDSIISAKVGDDQVESISMLPRTHGSLAGPDRGVQAAAPFEDVALSLGWRPRNGLRLSVDYAVENLERAGHGSVVMLRLSVVR